MQLIMAGLMLAAAALVDVPAGELFDLTEITERRSSDKTNRYANECDLTLRLNESLNDQVSHIPRVEVTRAVDNLGNDLTPDDVQEFREPPLDIFGKIFEIDLDLKNAPRNATSIEKVEGIVYFKPVSADGANQIIVQDFMRQPAEKLLPDALGEHGVVLFFLQHDTSDEQLDEAIRIVAEASQYPPVAMKMVINTSKSVGLTGFFLYADPEDKIDYVDFVGGDGKKAEGMVMDTEPILYHMAFLNMQESLSDEERKEMDDMSSAITGNQVDVNDLKMRIHLKSDDGLTTRGFLLENIELP